MLAFVLVSVALALGGTMLPCAARAEDEARSSTSISRDGRGLVYGVSGAFLLGLVPTTNVQLAVPDQPALQAGWAAYGRFGVELPPGVAIAIVGGGGGLGSAIGPVPLFLRALAEVRYTLDTGPLEALATRPFAAVAAGFLLLKAGPDLRATFTSQASIGLELSLAPWAVLEASIGAEVIAPGDALREVLVLALLPQIGAGFSY